MKKRKVDWDNEDDARCAKGRKRPSGGPTVPFCLDKDNQVYTIHSVPLQWHTLGLKCPDPKCKVPILPKRGPQRSYLAHYPRPDRSEKCRMLFGTDDDGPLQYQAKQLLASRLGDWVFRASCASCQKIGLHRFTGSEALVDHEVGPVFLAGVAVRHPAGHLHASIEVAPVLSDRRQCLEDHGMTVYEIPAGDVLRFTSDKLTSDMILHCSNVISCQSCPRPQLSEAEQELKLERLVRSDVAVFVLRHLREIIFTGCCETERCSNMWTATGSAASAVMNGSAPRYITVTVAGNSGQVSLARESQRILCSQIRHLPEMKVFASSQVMVDSVLDYVDWDGSDTAAIYVRAWDGHMRCKSCRLEHKNQERLEKDAARLLCQGGLILTGLCGAPGCSRLWTKPSREGSQWRSEEIGTVRCHAWVGGEESLLDCVSSKSRWIHELAWCESQQVINCYLRANDLYGLGSACHIPSTLIDSVLEYTTDFQRIPGTRSDTVSVHNADCLCVDHQRDADDAKLAAQLEQEYAIQKEKEAREKHRKEHPEEYIPFGVHAGTHMDLLPHIYWIWLSGYVVHDRKVTVRTSDQEWMVANRTHPKWITLACSRLKREHVCVGCGHILEQEKWEWRWPKTICRPCWFGEKRE